MNLSRIASVLCGLVVAASSAVQAQSISTPAQQKQRQALVRKLDSLLLPQVNFAEATADEAIEFLRIKAREVDPAQTGINLMLKLPDDEKKLLRPITLNLKDVPVSEALRYVAQLSGLLVQVEANVVTLTSVTYASTTLTTRVYNVPPGFLKPAGSMK